MYCMDNKTLKFVIIVTVSYHKTVCLHFIESATGTVIFFVRLSFANTFFFFFFLFGQMSCYFILISKTPVEDTCVDVCIIAN